MRVIFSPGVVLIFSVSCGVFFSSCGVFCCCLLFVFASSQAHAGTASVGVRTASGVLRHRAAVKTSPIRRAGHGVHG